MSHNPVSLALSQALNPWCFALSSQIGPVGQGERNAFVFMDPEALAHFFSALGLEAHQDPRGIWWCAGFLMTFTCIWILVGWPAVNSDGFMNCVMGGRLCAVGLVLVCLRMENVM